MTDANLDDLNHATFYVPFTAEDEDDEGGNIPFPKPLDCDYDLPEGEALRIDAYTKAWRSCLERVTDIMRKIYVPIVSEVEHEIRGSYNDTLPHLPYPEIPVIAIKDPSSSSALLDEIVSRTDSFDLDDAANDIAFTSHLYPNDCVTLTSAMKTLISGFVDRPHLLEKVKGRSAVSLVNYDIEMLLAWYSAICASLDSTEKDQPKLVVVLHDFEQLDITVVKDIFTISSLYVPRLPLVFLLAFSSPSPPSFLHTAYPRSILALLRISNYSIPSGEKVLEEVLHKTFFDSHFEPDLIIGPTVLAYLKDYYNRHNSSIDALLNILHIVHLKHFCGESLTLLVKSTPSFELLAKPTSLPFVRAVLARLKLAEAPNSASNTDVELSSIIDGTNRARASVYSRARRMRIGFGILSLVQDFVTNEGYKGLDWGHGIIDVMIRVLQGRGALKSDLKFLGIIVRKLKVTQLARLLESIHIFFNTMPPQVRSSEDEARTQLVLAINALPRQDDNDVTGTRVQVSANFSDWLVQYLNEILIPLDDLPLWDIWYTGASPFPVDLINPSMRATVVAGLLYPRDFAASSDDKDKEQGDPPLWELPDTSILFHRYLDSGKMINIYDWFTSFQLELETQKEELGKQVQAKSRPSSPKKRGGKGKAKVVEKDTETEDDVERWQLELQARFMRAMQELDYLGFLKHTGRKADHVQRIVFDMHDL